MSEKALGAQHFQFVEYLLRSWQIHLASQPLHRVSNEPGCKTEEHTCGVPFFRANTRLCFTMMSKRCEDRSDAEPIARSGSVPTCAELIGNGADEAVDLFEAEDDVVLTVLTGEIVIILACGMEC
jgi:hypothetical protein